MPLIVDRYQTEHKIQRQHWEAPCDPRQSWLRSHEPVRAIVDWFRPKRATAIVLKPVSGTRALRAAEVHAMAFEILKRAETERDEIAQQEAVRGISFADND